MEYITLVCTASLLAGGLYWFVCIPGSAEQKGKHTVNLTGGSIHRDGVQDKYKQYLSFFRRPKEIETADATRIPGKSHSDATRIHEEMVVDLLGVKPGDKILDAGCGFSL